MKFMNWEKYAIYDLPVKEVRADKGRLFYMVEAEGREYSVKQFDFQRGETIPKIISCMVKDIVRGVPQFVQNLEPLVKRLYQEGKTYPFQVRRILSDITDDYYEVGDSYGLCFRLQVRTRVKLEVRQQITCQVRRIKNGRVYLSLVASEVKNGEVSFLVLEEILEAVRASAIVAGWLRRCIMRLSAFAEVKEAFLNADNSWIWMLVRLLDANLEKWAGQDGKRRELLLDLFRDVCLYLLEDSDSLKKEEEEVRTEHVDLLSRIIRRVEGCQEAVELIASGKHVDYAAVLFGKLGKSGYLYDAENKLYVLMNLFRMEPSLMEQKIEVLLDVIVGNSLCKCTLEPYRSIFIQLLEIYISKNRSRLDFTGGIGCGEEKRALRLMIEVLAIQLLLAGDACGFDGQLKRGMLYRYLTYLKGSSPEVLMEKAFASLTGGIYRKLEYGWKDVRDLTLLTIRLSYPFPKIEGELFADLESSGERGAILRVEDGSVQLLPVGKQKKLNASLPEWLLPWHSLQVMLPDGAGRGVDMGVKDLTQYQKMWKEVEFALFDSAEDVTPKFEKRKVRPETGDKVVIRVLSQDVQEPDLFWCRIEDDVYHGEGTLRCHDMVRYNLNTDISVFRSNDGKAYLLEVEVLDVDVDGLCRFSLVRQLDSFVYQETYVGENVQCVVMEYLNGNYLCICSFGYSLYVPKVSDMPKLVPGDYIEVEVSEMRSNGYIIADYLRQVVENFRLKDAFADLIFNYANERVYEEEETPERNLPRQDRLMMDDSHIEELMFLIDRTATLEEDYIRSFNYLGFARLISILLAKEELDKYYLERMKLLHIRQLFVINGQVDMVQLKERKSSCRNMLAEYPMLQSDLLDLMVLGSLGYPEQNAFLWRILQQGGNEKREKLARLILAYNLLDGSSLNKQKEGIRNELDIVLNMDVGKHVSYSFGMENQHTEFKSSLVFPADNQMRPDLQKQTLEIMSIICGFLNADGGTLYLGVNDLGVACGLASDIEYFKGSLDKFDLHVRNSIVHYMGVEINAGISVSYPSAGEHLVYAIDVKPSSFPVACNGAYYQRQGSSTWLLQDKALDVFLKSKGVESCPEKAPEKVEVSEKTEASATVEVPDVEPASVAESTSAIATMPIGATDAEREIATSQLRPNVVHSWTEGYGVDTVGYLHLLSDNNYILTEEECWRNDVMLSLAIHKDEMDGYLILVFESGRVSRVAVNELLDKKLNKEYKRYSQEKVIFASMAGKDDALLTVMNDIQRRSCYRMDDVECLKVGNMLAKGDFLSVVTTTGVVQCDIIPAAKKPLLKRIHNMKPTNVGANLSAYWGGEELQKLEDMGVRLKS